MALLERAGLFSNDTHGATIARACSLEELRSAYRLVHDVFVQRGYINPCPGGIRTRVFEAVAETATFVANADGQVFGVTSVVIDSPDLGLPSDISFKPEIQALRDQGRVPCEGTNWVVAEAHRKSAIMSELMRCSFAHALAEKCTDFLGAVSPGHARFYGLLGFEQLGAQRSYSKHIDDPVVMVRLDLTKLAECFGEIKTSSNPVERFLYRYYIEDNPYHRFVAAWKVISRRLFDDPVLLGELFGQDSLVAKCSAAQLDSLKRRWGREMFDRVFMPGQGKSSPSPTTITGAGF